MLSKIGSFSYLVTRRFLHIRVGSYILDSRGFANFIVGLVSEDTILFQF